MFITDAVILHGARTPMALTSGAFDNTTAIDLGAAASKEAIRRAGSEPGDFDHVNFRERDADQRRRALRRAPCGTKSRIAGCNASSDGESPVRSRGWNPSRRRRRGFYWAKRAWCSPEEMENMSQCPHVIRGARAGFRLGEGKLEDSLMSGLFDTYCGFSMSETAENLAAEQEITRRASDEYALRSQQAAEGAFRAGHFKRRNCAGGSRRKAKRRRW